MIDIFKDARRGKTTALLEIAPDVPDLVYLVPTWMLAVTRRKQKQFTGLNVQPFTEFICQGYLGYESLKLIIDDIDICLMGNNFMIKDFILDYCISTCTSLRSDVMRTEKISIEKFRAIMNERSYRTLAKFIGIKYGAEIIAFSRSKPYMKITEMYPDQVQKAYDTVIKP